jgi:hypothetical protein
VGAEPRLPEAMLRASGFTIETRAADEVYICRRADLPMGNGSRPGPCTRRKEMLNDRSGDDLERAQ